MPLPKVVFSSKSGLKVKPPETSLPPGTQKCEGGHYLRPDGILLFRTNPLTTQTLRPDNIGIYHVPQRRPPGWPPTVPFNTKPFHWPRWMPFQANAAPFIPLPQNHGFVPLAKKRWLHPEGFVLNKDGFVHAVRWDNGYNGEFVSLAPVLPPFNNPRFGISQNVMNDPMNSRFMAINPERTRFYALSPGRAIDEMPLLSASYQGMRYFMSPSDERRVDRNGFVNPTLPNQWLDRRPQINDNDLQISPPAYEYVPPPSLPPPGYPAAVNPGLQAPARDLPVTQPNPPLYTALREVHVGQISSLGEVMQEFDLHFPLTNSNRPPRNPEAGGSGTVPPGPT